MPRSRSMGGCANCRRHHVKCDQSKPFCLVCSRHGRQCGGYERNIIFDGDNRQGAVKVRCQFFTENEQQRTSEALLAHVPYEGTTKILQDIDLLSEDASTDRKIHRQITLGPFGAFRVAAPSQTLNIEGLPDPLDTNNEIILPDLDMMLNIGMSGSDYGLCHTEAHMMPNATFALPALSSLDSVTYQTVGCWPEDDTQDHYHHLHQIDPSPMNFLSLNSVNQEDAIFSEAPFLLRHYRESVTTSQTPVQSDKTPWHILFFAHAKDAFATMSLAQTPDHASISVFYAILSISAFSYRMDSESQRWHRLANHYRQKAQGYLQRTWLEAFSYPKKIKYKAILMALLAIFQVSAFAGAFDQAESYLFDAEKFIRLCGLTKPSKSRKVRLLHHCYSFPRIFYESTCLHGRESSCRELSSGATEDFSALIAEQDSPVFKLGRWSELNETMTKIKTKESGENDLHLERPGLWNATLYPDIFGIPESFMVLLSQAIRLGNERAALEENEDPVRLTWKDFWSRTRSLEKCILQWRQLTLKDRLSWDPRLGFETASADRQALIRNMLEGLCEALSIYFYRRVHNLHPSLLQEKVRTVRDSLLRCDQAGNVLYTTAGFSWSAFIAACEAADPALQASYSMWFKARIQNVGWPCFSTMLEVVQKVWRKNQDDQEWIGWPEVLRSQDIRFFYS